MSFFSAPPLRPRVGKEIFPTDPALTNLLRVTPRASMSATASAAPSAHEESFLTTPLGAALSLGAVVGGIYVLAKNMGTTHGESRFT